MATRLGEHFASDTRGFEKLGSQLDSLGVSPARNNKPEYAINR